MHPAVVAITHISEPTSAVVMRIDPCIEDIKLPTGDLAENLISLFFLHVNTYYPLLHQPTFRKQFQAALYEKDDWFACLCFSVFAVASRWSTDPRVIPPPTSDSEDARMDWPTAGFHYYITGLSTTTHCLLS